MRVGLIPSHLVLGNINIVTYRGDSERRRTAVSKPLPKAMETAVPAVGE